MPGVGGVRRGRTANAHNRQGNGVRADSAAYANGRACGRHRRADACGRGSCAHADERAHRASCYAGGHPGCRSVATSGSYGGAVSNAADNRTDLRALIGRFTDTGSYSCPV